ncbi:hypothetical protein [Algoriphagus halophytocola]|uniref:Alpha-L-arabinofuranosidase 1 catalytic domain-containing protein n=1 Tax=Algoriphagus halophytocola TaxID=2991499 RepID=A0ABY6MJ92_9BACT|nr:hypothetical protein [Algoriphagus sp. TR-M5]UZD23862.1 hypothetical protein OM944_05060 [Algoriphagus sp. TR-M5]
MIVNYILYIIVSVVFLNKVNEQEEMEITATLKTEKISTPIYGFNGEFSRGPSLNTKSYFDSISSLKFRAIRYPGGGISSFWDWEKNKGVISTNNLKTPNHYLTMNSDIQGLNELLKLVNKTNCKVIFTLNMVTKDLDNQINLLKKAHEIGINISYIELGNEHNLKNNPGRLIMKTSSNYANICEKWIKRIKQEFPDSNIAMVGGNHQYSQDVINWNSIMTNIINQPEALAFHFYPSPNSALIDDEINFEKLHQSLNRQINNQGLLDIDPSLKIWITEYNIYWASKKYEEYLKDKELPNDRMFTWSQSLATCLMTIQLSLLPNTEVILNHSLANWIGFAAINNKTFEKTPNGIGMEIINKVSNQRDYFKKVIFNTKESTIEDFNLLGLKFLNNNNLMSKIILLNLTSENRFINIEKIINSKKYIVEHYKNGNSKTINGVEDISKTKLTIENKNTINIPPLSITIISEK